MCGVPSEVERSERRAVSHCTDLLPQRKLDRLGEDEIEPGLGSFHAVGSAWCSTLRLKGGNGVLL